MANLESLIVAPKATMREVMECIDRSGKGIVLVLDELRRLIGTVTDGDLRRSILAGMDVEHSVDEVLANRRSPFSTPQTAPAGASDDILLHLMNETGLRQIPLVDSEGHVVDVAFLNDLVKEYELPLRAVVMAGGFGTRLSL